MIYTILCYLPDNFVSFRGDIAESPSELEFETFDDKDKAALWILDKKSSNTAHKEVNDPSLGDLEITIFVDGLLYDQNDHKSFENGKYILEMVDELLEFEKNRKVCLLKYNAEKHKALQKQKWEKEKKEKDLRLLAELKAQYEKEENT